MLTTISYSESDIVALREMAELQYHTAYNKVVNETVTVDENTYNFDEIFMENCIYAGYNMNEAINAAMQKHKLLNSQEMKLVKRLAKQTRDFVKKGDYESAIPLAKKRLAHLENMVRRAESIDDDEQFIITAETMVKSYLYTIIATHVLGFIINGLLPGSGPLVTAIKKGIDAFKLTNLKAGLAGKSFGAAVTFIAGKFLTISGAAKLTGSYIAARKQRKWKKTRAGDVNREVNEGRPDTTHLSISRTQAKVKLKKLIQAQKEEIKILEDSVKIQAQKAKADNKLATVTEAADPESARLKRDVQVALNIKNGKPTKAVPNPFAVAAIGCPADKFEQYLKNAAKPNPKPFSKYLDKMSDEVKAKNAKAVTLIKSSMNHPVVFFHDSFEGALEFYDVTTGKIVNLSYDSGKIHIDGPYNVATYLKMHANAQDPDRAKYQQIAKTLSESAEVLDEGILGTFGASKYAKQFAGLLKTAQAVKNGTANGQIPSLEALSYIKCDPKIIENYFRKIAKKDPKIFDDFMSYVNNELDEDDERISVLNRKLVPHKNNPIVNLHANHPVKSEIFFYDASDNMIYQVSEDDDFDFNRTSISAQLKESYPDIFEKDYKKAMKIAGIKESAEILDEKFFGKHKADTNKKPPEKKANNAPVNTQELNRVKQEIQAALNLKNGKSVSSIPQLPILAFVNCPPNALEKYMQDNANKNSKIIENQIDDMIEYVDRYSSGRGIKDSDPKKYKEMQKDCKDAEERLRKMVNHKLFFFDTDADPETPLCFYDADTRKWVESSYLDGEAYVTEESVSGMLKKQEKRLRSTYMQSKVSLYQKALREIKTELSESASVLNEKFFGKRKAKKNMDHPATNDRGMNHAKQDIRTALSIKSGKDTKSIPNLYALAFVKCSPDVLEKYMQVNAAKNSRIIENHINRMNDYIDGYWEHGDDKETEPDKYTEVKKAQKNVEEYLRKAINHRLFSFTDRSHQGTTLYYYDADVKKWVEATYLDSEIEVNECSVTDLLKEYEKYLQSNDMQKTVSMYRKALQNMKGELSESVTLNEAKLKAAERNELPDSAFGIPSKRKFPLNDPAHVKAAVKMFRHASPADRPELARRIKRAIKKFNLDIEIGEDNPLHEYK